MGKETMRQEQRPPAKNICFPKDILNVIVAIDLQKQFKDNNGQYEKCMTFIKEHADDCYILGSVFKNFDDSMYEKHLHWSGCKDVQYSWNGQSPDIEYPYHNLILKSGYGLNSRGELNAAFGVIYDIAQARKDYSRLPVKSHLIGCDADACVLAAAFELWDRRCNFDILTDYIYTTAKDIDIETIKKIMIRNFGDCVV